MQKNWYIIYTKPKREKKVASTLNKRKIENYLPLNYRKISSFRKIKIKEDPLFKSYVFAKIAENEICKLKKVDGVINLVYWKGEPAKIKPNEIEVMKEFLRDHQNISLEKIKISTNDVARLIDRSRYSISGNILTIKSTGSKVALPSIGFTLCAKVELTGEVETESVFDEKDLLLQS